MRIGGRGWSRADGNIYTAMAINFENVRILALQALDSDGEALLRSLSPERVSKSYSAFNNALTKAKTEHEAIKPNSLEVDNFNLIRVIVSMFFYMKDECLEAKIRALELTPDNLKANAVPDALSASTALFWSRKRRWTNIEAALLSVGFDPSVGIGFSFEESFKLFPLIGSPIYDEARVRFFLLNEHSTDIRLINASPPDFLDWFSQMRFSFPTELEKQTTLIYNLDTRENREGGDLKSLERKTLLRLLLGMAVRGYGFDPAQKRNPTTKDIVADLDFLGIGLDPKTVLKWLRIASNEIPLDDIT